MKRWIPWMAVAIVLALVAAGALRAVGARNAQKAQAAMRAEPVVMDIAPDEILTLRSHQLVLGVPVSGAVRAVNTATIKARVAGELQDLSLREGDAVRAGQVLARIDATESQARLRQAQEQADAAQAQVQIAKRQVDNNQALVAQGFISKTALDTSQSSLESAKASHQAALAAADVARKALADTVLRSPIDGAVAQRFVQNGERVGVDARVLEVVDLDRLEVEVQVTAADATRVRVGQTAQLRAEGSNQTISARVVRINPSAQAGSRAVPVYLSISDTTGLRQGLFLQGQLLVGQEQALALPLDAVRIDQAEPYVQVADGDRVAHKTVQLGARTPVDGTTWVQLQGLSEGTKVLAARVGALPAGTQIRLSTASAPRGAASGTH